MTRPGERLRALIAHVFGDSMCRRVIDPVVADLQHEYALVAPVRTWRRRFVHMRGIAAALHGLTTFGLSHASHVGRVCLRRSYPPVVGLTAGLVSGLIALLGIAGLALLEVPVGTASRITLLRLLLPSAFPIAVPVGFAVTLAIMSATERRTRAMICAAAVAASATVGWSLNHVVPDANQAFRIELYADRGRAPSRGATELGFGELLQVSRSREAQVSYSLRDRPGEPPPSFWLQARLALAAAPLIMALLTLGTTTQWASVRRRLLICSVTVGFLAWYLLIPRASYAVMIDSGTPAWLAAWVPNLVIAAISIVIRFKARRSKVGVLPPPSNF
jgi:hypothetical protein